MSRSYFSLGMSLLGGMLIAASLQAEEIFFDNFQQFPPGTVLTSTNYIPPIGVSASIQSNNISGENSTTVTASNLLGNTVAFFNPGTPPYAASYLIDPIGVAQSNQVLTLRFLLSMPALTNSANFGGLSISGLSTNLDGSTNSLSANSLVLINDGGQVFTFTNTPSPQTAVQIGSWSNLVGQLTTNQLVLDYTAGTFSFSINNTILANLPIPSYYTNSTDQLGLEVEENVTNNGVASLGNSFALGDIQLLNANLVTNQDVTFYVAAEKGQFFQQFSTNSPSLMVTGFTFQALVQGSSSNALVSGTDRIPSGAIVSLMPSNSDNISFEQDFATQEALDNVYSNGIYTLSIVTTNQGTFSPSLILPPNDYPTNAPQILNFTAAQMVDASTNFVLQWSPFINGTNTDLISVSLMDTNGVNVFQTPGLGETGQLFGTATSVVISGGVLQAGETYTGTVSFVKITDSDTNSIPGALGVTAYSIETEFTLTTLPPPCSFTLSQDSITLSAASVSTDVTFTANETNCEFTVVSNDSFINVTSATNGFGSGTVSFNIAANTNATSQIGSISIGDQTFVVVQAAFEPCSFTLSPVFARFAASGGSSNVSVVASGSNCVWTAMSNNSFITITSPTSGSGSGAVSFTVSANTNAAEQTGTLTIGGQTFTVLQDAAIPCSFSLSPSYANVSSGNGTTNVTVIASGSNCVWTAVSNSGFITITSAASGTGSGTVSFAFSANTNATAQIGTLTIGGQTFVVVQQAPTIAPACAFSLGSSSANFGSAGGSSNVSITASSSNCVYTAVSNSGFITITSTNTPGSGFVSYNVLSNTTMNALTGTVTIAGSTFTVIEAGQSSIVQTSLVDLAVTISNTPNPVLVGSNLTYLVTVTNEGTNSVNGVVLVDTYPTNETFVSAMTSQGTIAQTVGAVTNTIGTLTAGSHAVLTFVITPAETAVAMITNTATVSTSTNGTTTAVTNAVAVATVGEPIQPPVGLNILEMVSTNQIYVDTNFTYTLTVTNAGPNIATSVVVTDQLPADLTVVATSATTGTVTNLGSLVIADLGDLSSGAVAQVSIEVTPTAFGVLTNTASVGELNATGSTVTLITPVGTVDFLTVTKLTAPSKITLTSKRPSLTAKIIVDIENTGTQTVTIPLDELSNIVTVVISSTNCAPPVTQVVIPKKPIVLAPKKSVAIDFTADFTCADTYSYTATVNHSVLDGSPTDETPSDVCPRPPNPATGDKGCGDINKVTKQSGAPVTTVVTLKP